MYIWNGDWIIMEDIAFFATVEWAIQEPFYEHG